MSQRPKVQEGSRAVSGVPERLSRVHPFTYSTALAKCLPCSVLGFRNEVREMAGGLPLVVINDAL